MTGTQRCRSNLAKKLSSGIAQNDETVRLPSIVFTTGAYGAYGRSLASYLMLVHVSHHAQRLFIARLRRGWVPS